MQQVQVALDTAAMFMAVLLTTAVGVVLYALVLILARLAVVRDARLDQYAGAVSSIDRAPVCRKRGAISPMRSEPVRIAGPGCCR